MPKLVVKLSEANIRALGKLAKEACCKPGEYAEKIIVEAVRGHKVTIVDVAKAAGVSSMTVSCALNGGGRRHEVAAATRERIEKVAKQMGYRPNLAAIAMRKRATELRRAGKLK